MSEFILLYCEKHYSDMSRSLLLHCKNNIRTCPDFYFYIVKTIFGHVRIFTFTLYEKQFGHVRNVDLDFIFSRGYMDTYDDFLEKKFAHVYVIS